jgi:hypothetical protein
MRRNAVALLFGERRKLQRVEWYEGLETSITQHLEEIAIRQSLFRVLPIFYKQGPGLT